MQMPMHTRVPARLTEQLSGFLTAMQAQMLLKPLQMEPDVLSHFQGWARLSRDRIYST